MNVFKKAMDEWFVEGSKHKKQIVGMSDNEKSKLLGMALDIIVHLAAQKHNTEAVAADFAESIMLCIAEQWDIDEDDIEELQYAYFCLINNLNNGTAKVDTVCVKGDECENRFECEHSRCHEC